MPDTCPTCGHAVHVVSDDEGTFHYEPVHPGSGDAAFLVAWLREAADELEKAHFFMDQADIPRVNPATGRPFTLAARFAWSQGAR